LDTLDFGRNFQPKSNESRAETRFCLGGTWLREKKDALFRQARQKRDDLQDAFNEGEDIYGEIIELSVVENRERLLKGESNRSSNERGSLSAPLSRYNGLAQR
jgi:hypothetical protein